MERGPGIINISSCSVSYDNYYGTTVGCSTVWYQTSNNAGFSPEIFVSVVKVYTNVYEARGEKSVIIL